MAKGFFCLHLFYILLGISRCNFITAQYKNVADICLQNEHFQTQSLTECILGCGGRNLMTIMKNESCYCISTNCFNNSKHTCHNQQVYFTKKLARNLESGSSESATLNTMCLILCILFFTLF